MFLTFIIVVNVMTPANYIFVKSGSVVAAYGNADQSDWRTTGVCFDAVRLWSERETLDVV